MTVPTISQRHLRHNMDAALKVYPQLNAQELLDQFDISLTDDEESRIPLEKMTLILNEVSRITNDPLLGLHAYTQVDWKQNSLAATILPVVHTVKDSIEFFIRYLCLITELGELKLKIDGSRCHVVFIPTTKIELSHHQIDGVLLAIVKIWGLIGITDNIAVNINTENCRSHYQEYQTIFGVPVSCNATEHSASFDAFELDRVINEEASPLQQILKIEKLRNQTKNEEFIKNNILWLIKSKLMYGGTPSIDEIAKAFSVSRRTLQRHLDKEQTAYKDLVAQCRKDLAIEYLSEGKSNEDIAFLLGYEQTSHFYRAFKTWFGTTPSEYKLNA